MRPASVGFQCPDCVKQGNASMRPAKAAYGGRAQASPTVTFVLLGINVVMFLLTTATGTGLVGGSNPSELFQRLAMAPTYHPVLDGNGVATGLAEGVAQGQYYRLLTATFLHFGLIHIALNMLALFQLGPALEAAFGRLRFTALYLLSGVSGTALSYALGPRNVLAAGASGAVFGLFAAFFVLERKRGNDVTQIGAIIAFNLFVSFAYASYIDWRGHVGGMVGGGLLTAALVYAPRGPQRWAYQLVGFAGVAVLVAGLVMVRTSALA